MSIKLYWAPHTRSLRALWVLEEAGLPYERVFVDLSAGVQETPAFRAINPMAKVPALTDGDVAVAESGAICAYIADKVPQANLAPPIGDPARGRYLQWLFFAVGNIEAAYMQKFTGFSMPSQSAGFGSFDRVIDVLEAAVSKGPWLLGDRFSAADVMVGSDLYFGLQRFKIVPSRAPLQAYVDRCLARPAMERAMAIDAAGA